MLSATMADSMQLSVEARSSAICREGWPHPDFYTNSNDSFFAGHLISSGASYEPSVRYLTRLPL